MSDFDEKTKKNLIEKGLVFEQLMQSNRFREFFAINFDLARDENKNEFFLVEVPLEVVAQRTQQAMEIKMREASAQDIVAPSEEEVNIITGKK